MPLLCSPSTRENGENREEASYSFRSALAPNWRPRAIPPDGPFFARAGQYWTCLSFIQSLVVLGGAGCLGFIHEFHHDEPELLSGFFCFEA